MSSVHRLLDQAFAGIPLTPDAADLKEELRTGLIERAAELHATGISEEQAAARAVAELGDIRALLDDGSGSGAPIQEPRPSWSADHDLIARNKVRPKAGFVVGIVLAALAGVGAATAYTLLAVQGTVAALPWLAALAGLAVGWILSSSLAQETTTNHPLPRGRAAAWGLAAMLVTIGVGVGLVAVPAWGDDPAVVWIIAGGSLVVAGCVLFTWLGVTQTNRKKAWTRQLSGNTTGVDNFSRDPASAARFGIYTAAIWATAFLGCVVLGFTVGWRLAWTPLVAGWIVMMLVLARMNFGSRRGADPYHR